MFSPILYFFFVSMACQQFFVCFAEESVNLQARDRDRFSGVLSRKTREIDDLTDQPQFCQGPPGLNGLNGLNGRDGRDGVCSGDSEGRKGEKGEPGNDGVTPTGPPSSSTSQTVFVRWGRTTCPDSAGFIYEGLVGGTSWDQSGGGSEYLCLPLDPIYNEFEAGVGGNRAYMYGAEYETNTANFGGYDSLHNHDVPCAVCLAPRGTLLNIPARNVCPSGWVLEYSGYLMASYFNQASTKKHICVDNAPETRDGTSSNLNGALLYFVEGRCGSLPCSPYVDGNELTCAVCTM